MFNRRQVLLSGNAATVAYASAGAPFAFANTSGQKLDKLFDSFMAVNLDRSPESTTGLGLDTGARAWEKSKLDSRSLDAIALRQEDQHRTASRSLQAIRSRLAVGYGRGQLRRRPVWAPVQRSCRQALCLRPRRRGCAIRDPASSPAPTTTFPTSSTASTRSR